MRSLSEQHREQPQCGECGIDTAGELFLYPTEQALTGANVAGLCAECFSRKENRTGHIVITRRQCEHPSDNSDKRFEALFKAARVMLRAGIGGEDRIIPTLRLAHERGWRAPRLKYEAVRVVEVVEGVPILERVGTTARGIRSLTTGALTDFAITLWPRAEKVAEKEIVGVYENALKAEGVEWGKTGGRIAYDLNLIRGYYVLLTVERGPFSKMRGEEAWPSPSFVGQVARAALEEFADRLVIRYRGGERKPDTLIPAYVAYLMRHSLPVGTEVSAWGEILWLLEQHVLCEVPQKSLSLLEQGYASISPVTQLQRDVRKIAKAEERIPDPGPYETK